MDSAWLEERLKKLSMVHILQAFDSLYGRFEQIQCVDWATEVRNNELELNWSGAESEFKVLLQGRADRLRFGFFTKTFEDGERSINPFIDALILFLLGCQRVFQTKNWGSRGRSTSPTALINMQNVWYWPDELFEYQRM